MSTPLAHDAIIQDSWRRCRAYGLDHQSTPSFDQLPADGVSQLLESQHSLVQTTHQEVLPYYENILSNSNCLIMLADNQGQVLTSWGTQRFIDPKLARGFSAGASWMERSSGTNAIGTALACAQAVHIEHDEHFLKANRFMTGSAAPIFDAQREIIAVLDVSSDSYLPPSHTLGMVKMMSQTVENRLILNLFRGEHFQLTFNTGLNNLDSQWAGLLIFDESGQVLSANRRADNLLGISLSRVLIDSLFKVSLLELLNQPEGLPFSLQAAGRNRFQCLLKRPKQAPVQARVFVETKKPREPGPTAISLKTLHFGDARVEKAVRQAERLLEKDIPLLIHGETGVGKEVFVKALHQASSRSQQAFIAVNCAAIPAELVESELFGYEKGAFTGANQKGSIGLIRKADKGTLFLDEIGDMPLPTQARLLRVLQERCVQPVGSSELYPVDLRIISATNRSLREQVQLGRFREDLYYRIGGLTLELPPLRERTDKQALFKQLWQQHREPTQWAGLSNEVLALFEQHPWPGNLRQVSSVLQVALAMAEEQPIRVEHLPDDFFVDLNGVVPVCDAVDDSLDLNERLKAVGGNISHLARELGVSRNTLYKRLRQNGNSV
ncbi:MULTISPECIES: sigma-54-dependent Fis family transcriptional regulator [Pseudomonas]|jgi:sigma-54 dependent transcriptional regulator, acetoin dehydrogenase operon transcriptional activator AcoR|uniref:sigma-54-dependent Fis family transcriptional regulator n=2 Tax=Pseudomonas TaxID=286 RepID=UPI000281CFC8|nr:MULTISPECIES: sigma-54-dependent Fis family transcriptional regulator [Pseudomonas]AUO23889.1 sigma-54-dependent Fis family transcriptional regulator [Pseudomonas sp. NC02]PMU20676.1 sigma-54-dependent Fis family transcriptional regulator [Pseudomonas sp. GP01-A13]PMU25771.1 sigma-54-dependent Fis family transcriptional regulator [Pseudomonas sp. GP01-A9]PMU41520.1 sigma-54-dependent Fis family transcriptional regulator [Pseudomonas sp. GP01-A8]PMU44967.1 sigma-54-dependent Fis family trans